MIPAIAASMSPQACDAMMKNKNVAYIEPDHEVHALQQTLPWGVDRIDADLVWSYNKGTGVKVAIIDTGIDYTHPDLDANYRGGYDFVNDDADPKDDHGHGTHCAGIVAAEDNDIGVVGVAPEALPRDGVTKRCHSQWQWRHRWRWKGDIQIRPDEGNRHIHLHSNQRGDKRQLNGRIKRLEGLFALFFYPSWP